MIEPIKAKNLTHRSMKQKVLMALSVMGLTALAAFVLLLLIVIMCIADAEGIAL